MSIDEVDALPLWQFELYAERMNHWLPLLNGLEVKGETGAGGAPKPRTITFAQAVAEGIIPPSGEPATKEHFAATTRQAS